MSITLSQANRPLQAKTPLGPDELVPISLEGEEAVSRPFRFVVDFMSTNLAVSPGALLGKPIGLTIAMPEGAKRQIHGIVRRFTHLGIRRDLARYRAEIVPQLWFLSQSANCATFEEKSIPDIVEKVCKDAGVTDFSRRIVGSYKPEPFVVQYRESSLDFVSRLLEAAGLYYTFEHGAEKHTMVISDAHGGSVPAGAVATVRVGLLNPGESVDIDTVTELAREHTVHTGKVKFKDHALLRADSAGDAQSSHPGATGTLYDFLGDLGPNDSATEARREIERAEATHDQVAGASTCASFTAGTRVKLTGGLVGSGGVELQLLRVAHHMTVGDNYSGTEATYANEFHGIEASVKFRPPETTDWPSVQGTQTAKVVGTGGAGEIDVDAAGCVLLQFPWDTGDGKDGKSKHRVHVASIWAGAEWGFVQHARIGHEVLVEFLEGDPNRPIVTGRVYNSANKYPYALPANKTQSGVKTRSLGGGPANFNELRFEDKKGSEQVYLHAEKNLDTVVENDETRAVGHDCTTTIDHDETWHVKHDETGTVDNNQSHTIGKNATHTVGENETIAIGKDQGVTIGGTRNTDIGKDDVISISGKLAVTVGKSIAIEAADEIVLKCGQSSITMKKNGDITIKGMNLTMDASAKVQVKASADVSIKGAKIAAEGQAQTEIKGAMVKIEGQAMTTIKGSIAQITGDAMLKAAGGITMLG